jgi:hypothetical protein
MDSEKLIFELAGMIHNRLDNYIVPGLESYLVGGGEHGKVRIFHQTREARDWITPHSHRFSFTALVISGAAHQTLFYRHPDDYRLADQWCLSTIDQVCGTDGLRDYCHVRDTTASRWTQQTTSYGKGKTYSMQPDEIHSVVFDKGTVVLFLESPQLKTQSVMLEPWVNGKCVPTFRTEPWMFEKVQP